MILEIQPVGTLEWRSGEAKTGGSLVFLAALALFFVCAGVLVWLFWPKEKAVATVEGKEPPTLMDGIWLE